MIDTHAHYNSKVLNDLELEIDIINKSDITAIINVGLDLESDIETIDISNHNSKFFAAIGIHPLHSGNVEDLLYLYNTSQSDKIVAIGETGLDIGGDIQIQTTKFIQTIELANYLRLPIIIHAKGTNQDVMRILQFHIPQYGFVFHCFQPNIEIASQIIAMGGYISVASPITKPTANKSLQIIREISLEHLLIELDYPYMSQTPYMDGRNTFNKIKEIKHMNKIDLETALDNNAKRLFKKINISGQANSK